METITEIFEIEVGADGDMKDITPLIDKAVKKHKIKNGVAVVFSVGSTGAISTIEYEPNLIKDMKTALERIAPSSAEYEHHKTWGDDNGRSHVRATIIGPSITVPIVNGKLTLGTWQQIVVINLDTRKRVRKVVLQIIGECY